MVVLLITVRVIEDLWLDYVEYTLTDMNIDGVHTYFDKQSLERIVIDEKMMNKAKVSFIERLEKRRSKEAPLNEESNLFAQVIDFSQYKTN